MKETAEFSIGGDAEGIAVEMGNDGAQEEVKRRSTQSIEFNTDDTHEEGGEEKNAADDADMGDGDAVGDEGDADPDADADGDADGEDQGSEEALGDFDPEDPDVVEKFDSWYTLEDGSIDAEGALSKEFFANKEKGIDGLNDATYEYLASKGISKATIKQVEAMAETQRDAEANSVKTQDFKLFDIAGGSDKLQEALKWGKEGGYTEAQQKRFNQITKGKDFEAKQEAVEALMARYNRANPPAKPKLPKRDATKGQGKVSAGVKPFANRKEMREARSTLRDNDTQGWSAFNARLKVSRNLD